MARIIALDHIVLNVADVERSLAYAQTLGMAAERVEAWRRGELRFPSVRVNEATIIDLVHAPAAGEDERRENLAHFCLVTDAEDLDAVAQELTSAGVVIERGPGMRSGARGNALSLYFRDPDHNLIELRTYAGVAASPS
jgi:catechol 2,3-dioxygenase-like lactoylglutathione lyase family enzyme